MNKSVVLITGATTGIGLSLTKALLKDEQTIVFAAARSDSLHRISYLLEKNKNLIGIPLNILDQSERDNAVKYVKTHFGRLDVLVNNAGISFRSSLEDMSEEEELLQMRTNYLAPMELIKSFLPLLRESKNPGRIINVSSVSGLMAMPSMGSYSASKFALEGASESLWYELKPWNIHVTLVQPGFVRSDAFHNVRYSALSRENVRYQTMYRAMGDFVARLMKRALATPETVAETIIKVMHHPSPPLRVIPSIDGQFFFLLRRLLPRRVYHWVLYRSLPHIKDWEHYALHHP